MSLRSQLAMRETKTVLASAPSSEPTKEVPSAATAGDDRVSGQDEGVGMARRDRARLRLRQPHDMGCRQFAPCRRLVDIGRVDAVGDDPDLTQQLKPARRGGGKHQERHGFSTQLASSDSISLSSRRKPGPIDRQTKRLPSGSRLSPGRQVC